MRIGPFKFSPTAVYIAFISSLITVPAGVLITTLFKRARSKKEVNHVRQEGLSNITLPYWVKYISYFLCFALTIICGFFIILYSFEFGKSRANKWLFKVIVSFVQTVIIVEPLKVVVISLALAMIIRKIDQSVLDAIAPHEIADEDKRFLDLCSFEEELDSQPLIAPKPPSGQ